MRALVACWVLCWLCYPLEALAFAPTTNLHELKWLGHVDMIDPAAGRDLAYYAAIIDQAVADATVLVEGDQGMLLVVDVLKTAGIHAFFRLRYSSIN